MVQHPAHRPARRAPATFPHISATHCTCCHQPLTTGEGFEIALLGVFGPVCILKFAPLGAVLAKLQGIESRVDSIESMELGYYARSFLMGLGYEATFEDTAEGVKTLRIGRLGHRRNQYRSKLEKVLATWQAQYALMEERLQALRAERARQAQVLLAPRLGNVRAARLHRVLDGLGLTSAEHFEVAGRALGTVVESFAALRDHQFTLLWADICDRWPWAEAEAATQGLAA